MKTRFILICAFIFVAAAAGWLVQAQNQQAQPLKVEKIKDDLYVITGDAGNTTVYVTDEGLVLVDDKFARNYDELVSKVRSISDKPIRFVFNTHAHGDHTGGNEKLAATATIIAHENARAAMVAGKQPGLPQVTYKDEITVTLGGKRVIGYHFGRAHTNGDTFVLFPAAQVLAAGDSFNNDEDHPGTTGGFYGLFIAYQTGGSLADMPKTLDGVMKLDFDTVIPGHGPVGKRADFLKWREEVEKVRNRIAAMVGSGMSRDRIEDMLVTEFGWAPKRPPIRALDQIIAELRP